MQPMDSGTCTRDLTLQSTNSEPRKDDTAALKPLQMPEPSVHEALMTDRCRYRLHCRFGLIVCERTCGPGREQTPHGLGYALDQHASGCRRTGDCWASRLPLLSGGQTRGVIALLVSAAALRVH
ncbi:hypothetical protein FIBSPDRAFT_125845 [Athelia psychrophila]|uniref:Uncharacterized protein n=1 Tax=Athelia psychrophila TaxID=1759441 RepID=A0A166T772_9AGAM|nr:hypothetical protein FIBSPDRAFT_125845 [Fibularhizoctonia sp. CBS 109695]